MRWRAPLALVAAILLPSCAGASPPAPAPPPLDVTRPPPAEDAPRGRLPEGIEPRAYRLRIEVTPGQRRFRGRVEIDLALERPTELVWLHGRRLDVESVEARVGDERIEARWHDVVPNEGVAAVRLARAVGPGAMTLAIRYRGELLAPDALEASHATVTQRLGFYAGRVGGRAYAATQFETVGARAAFPCLDEPRFRAPFTLELDVPRGQVVASNTRIVERARRGDRERVRFAATDPLPTYLVGWIVGPYRVVRAPSVPANETRDEPLPLRGFTPPRAEARMRWVLERTRRLLGEAERWLGAPFPFDRLAMAFVPDHPYLGMENASLITIDVGGPTRPRLGPDAGLERYSTEVIAHEIVHQWLGDLVTLPWWDEHFLKEALTQFVAVRITDAAYGERRRPRFFYDMARWDSGRRPPVLSPVGNAVDIEQRAEGFWQRAEAKVEHVLDGLERWLGAAALRDAIAGLVARHAGGAATHEDFAAELDRVSHGAAGAAFLDAVRRPGVPDVSFHTACDDERAGLVIASERTLPVCVRYGAGETVHEGCVLVESGEAFLPFEGGGCADWYAPNAGGAGYHHVVLDAPERARVLSRFDALEPAEQAALFGSLRAQVDRGSIDLEALVPHLRALASAASHPSVVLEVIRTVAFIRSYLVEPADRPAVDAWARGVLRPLYARWGWSDDSDDAFTAAAAEELLAFLALDLRDREVRADAIRRVRSRAGDAGPTAAQHRAREPFRVALAVAAQEDPEAELPASPARRTFARAFAPDRSHAALTALEAQDRSLLGVALRYLLTNPDTRPATWSWVESRVGLVRRPETPFVLFETLDRGMALVPLCDPARFDAVTPRHPRLAAARRRTAECARDVQRHGPGVRRALSELR